MPHYLPKQKLIFPASVIGEVRRMRFNPDGTIDLKLSRWHRGLSIRESGNGQFVVKKGLIQHVANNFEELCGFITEHQL